MSDRAGFGASGEIQFCLGFARSGLGELTLCTCSPLGLGYSGLGSGLGDSGFGELTLCTC